jgi:translation initiation factor eIF-2B subunit epsilon
LDHKTHQILSFHNDPRSGRFGINLDFLKEHDQMELRYDLLDCSIDICSPEVLIHFSDNYDYTDIRRDYLHREVQNKELGWKYHAHILDNEYAARVQDLRTYDSICRDMLRRWTYPLVPDSNINGSTNFRLHGNGTFKENNVLTHRSVKLGPNVILGSGTAIEENSEVTNTTLGRNVHIGSNVLILNSYIWDDVIIEDNCSIVGAVICNAALVKTGCNVRQGTVISFGATLEKNTVTNAYSRYTNIPPSKDEFADEDEPTEGDESSVGISGTSAHNTPSNTHTITTTTLLAAQRNEGFCTTREWSVKEWDVTMSESEPDSESDSDASEKSEYARIALEQKKKLLKLQNTSIISENAVQRHRWYDWGGVDLVALGYESEGSTDTENDMVDSESFDGETSGSDISDGDAAASARNESAEVGSVAAMG